MSLFPVKEEMGENRGWREGQAQGPGWGWVRVPRRKCRMEVGLWLDQGPGCALPVP